MWARRSEPLTARTVLESETRGKGGFPEPAVLRIPSYRLARELRPELDLRFRVTTIRPSTPFRLASIRTPSESRWTRCSMRFV